MRRGKPAKSREPVEEEHVRRETERISQQALAVSPEPIFLSHGSGPTVPLPALQRDPRHPPRPLPNRGSQRARKELSRGDGFFRAGLQRNEDLRAPEPVKTHPVLVIFGEAVRLKHAIAGRRREFLQSSS